MVERPILFSGEMVRAILTGRKTQTRRVVTVPWHKGKRVRPYEPWYVEADDKLSYQDEYGDYHPMEKRCPYGQPGDRLWVRESVDVYVGGGFEQYDDGLKAWQETFELRYLADDYTRRLPFFNGLPEDEQWQGVDYAMLKRMSERDSAVPSIHMPRWASRITLEITGVRTERVQEITDDDAIEEGIEAELCLDCDALMLLHREGEEHYRRGTKDEVYPAQEFAVLWDSINAKRGYGWDVNPWVWVVEFNPLNQEKVKSDA